MLVLPLRCRSSYCGYQMEIYSNESMPRCPVCSDAMRPNGPVREVEDPMNPPEKKCCGGTRAETDNCSDGFGC